MKKKSAFKQKNKALFTRVELHTYDTLKMAGYVRVIVEKDYSPLVKIGQPTPEQLQDGWLDILSEYQKHRIDPDLSGYYEETQEKSRYEYRKAIIEKIIFMLRQRYEPALIEELVTEGYDYDFDEDTYLDGLTKVEAELASEAMYFDKEEGVKEEPTKQKYIAKMMQLQKDLKACPMLTPMQMMDSLTVAEYVEYLNQHDEYIASQTPKETVEDYD